MLVGVKGEFALAREEFEQAKSLATDVVRELRQHAVRSALPEALYLQGRALLGLGQLDGAHEVLSEARAEAEALGARRLLWPILAALGELQARRGDSTSADSLREGAHNIVAYIADHSGAPELRASFCSLPEVRAVLGERADPAQSKVSFVVP